MGLQPLIMGYSVKEVPVSWIGRGTDMGTSSFHLHQAAAGYGRVLRGLWLRRFFGVGRYRALTAKTRPTKYSAFAEPLRRISTVR
jgi:hypothetical protein